MSVLCRILHVGAALEVVNLFFNNLLYLHSVGTQSHTEILVQLSVQWWHVNMFVSLYATTLLPVLQGMT